MAKGIELTINEACKHPECFMYVWVTGQFLNTIDPKYASIIRVKRANQKKVLMLSADKYLGGFDKVNQYYDAIAQAFNNTYGMSPYNALIVLAQGGEVAGKNWSEGVYGIGATRQFNVQVDGKDITVDKTTGHIYMGTEDITDEQDGIVYAADKKGNAYIYQVFSKNTGGYVFCSQYNKTLKTYYAQCYSDADGKTYTATGKETTGSDGGSIWGNININWDWIRNILNWILSIFGIQQIPDLDTNTETLSIDNTVPNQTMDGFVTKEAGISTTGAILLLAAGGAILMNKGKFKKSGKKNK